MEILAQLKKIKPTASLTKWKFGSVVDIYRPNLQLPTTPVAPIQIKQKPKLNPSAPAFVVHVEEKKEKFLDVGTSVEWKKMHDWFHAVLRYMNPLVELMTKDQFVTYRNDWFTKEIEFLGTSGAKGSPFQRARNDIRAAFNNYQMQSARDEGYGGLKTHDEEKTDSKESMILIRYICWRAGIQCIWLEDDHSARPFPQDPRQWSAEVPIFFWDRKRRAMGLTEERSSWAALWISNWEASNKTFQFPEADGKKSEILAAWKKYTAYKSSDDKLKKDELAHILGRAETIKLFTSWTS